MTKIYTYEEIDIDIKVFFNSICIPAVVGVVFSSVYAVFVLGAFMIFLYEFILLDNYNELYSDKEIEVKKDTLFLTYILYGLFLFVFWSDIINYIRG